MKNIEMFKDKSGDYCSVNKNVGLLHLSSKSPQIGFFAKRILSRIERAEHGNITVTLPNKHSVSHMGARSGQTVLIGFKMWKSFFQYVLFGQLSFVEAYINGEIYINNLQTLFHWFIDNELFFSEKQNSHLSDLIHRFSHLIVNDNSRNGSRKNISFHYDLGNDFYKRWLDETMTYSAGIFTDETSLSASQTAKYARIIEQLELTDDDRVLEIGCGWGGFADHALTRHHIDYRGITISNEQLKYTKARLDKITVRKNLAVFEDYRDTVGTFDKIVSIEMFEAVGEKHWKSYFETIKSRLKPGGKAVIQVITIDHDRFLKYRNRVDFIQKYIFPGGMLPSKQVFADHVEEANLKIEDEFAFGHDYAQTLRLWKESFIQSWSDIEQLGFDRRFYRLWLYYLDYCIAAFERNTIDVMHYTVTHDHA